MAFSSFIEIFKKFFNDFEEFLQKDHQKIVDYYVQDTEFPKDSFDNFDLLLKSCEIVKENIVNFRNSINNLYFFEVTEKFESCVHILDMISNYSKWFQSSSIKGRNKIIPETDFILKQNETLEDFSTRIGLPNRETGSLDLALDNHIREIDYNTRGGTKITAPIQVEEGVSLSLNTVVDELMGLNILGRDIQQKILFENDDLVCLTPEKTFEQVVKLICKLFKGNNPEFPNSGLDKSFLSNKNGLCIMLPTVMRQLNEIVSTEDTIRNFSIKSIDNRGDAMKIDLEFESVLSNQISQTIDGN